MGLLALGILDNGAKLRANDGVCDKSKMDFRQNRVFDNLTKSQKINDNKQRPTISSTPTPKVTRTRVKGPPSRKKSIN